MGQGGGKDGATRDRGAPGVPLRPALGEAGQLRPEKPRSPTWCLALAAPTSRLPPKGSLDQGREGPAYSPPHVGGALPLCGSPPQAPASLCSRAWHSAVLQQPTSTAFSAVLRRVHAGRLPRPGHEWSPQCMRGHRAEAGTPRFRGFGRHPEKHRCWAPEGFGVHWG